MLMSGPRQHILTAIQAALLLLVCAAAPASGALPDSASFAPYGLRTEMILDRDALEAAGIHRPTRLVYDSDGNLHVLDEEARRVVKLDPKGRAIYDVGGYGTDEASLELPVDIVVDRDQSLLVLDRGRGALIAYDRAGRFLGQRLFQGEAAEESREAGARILLDRFGKLWLLSPRARDLVALDDRLEPKRTTRFLLPEDSLRQPMAVASTPGGSFWILDAGRPALLRFDPSGRLSQSLPFDHASERLSLTDLAVDRAGYLYVGDRLNQSVRAFGEDIDGLFITLRVFGGDRIAWRPAAVAVGPRRQIALADPERDEIQIVVPVPRIDRVRP